MTRSVTHKQTHLAQIELDRALTAAQRYSQKSRSEATWRAYRSDWRQFESWCSNVGLTALPADPDTVAMFVASQADDGRNPSTLSRRLAAIRLVHLGAGHTSPHNALKVAEVMRGIRRDWATPPATKKPALDEDIKKMVDLIDVTTRKGLRDRSLLLFGFAGAFRRSELVALDCQDLEKREEGFLVRIRQSKTDQEAQGQTIAIPRVPGSSYCPVAALDQWLKVSGINSDAVFRRMFRGDKVGQTRLSSQSISLVIKDLAHAAGLDPSGYAGHSLRSGFLTSAARHQANLFKMADQSRHRSLETLRQYVRDEERFVDNAAEGLLSSK
ncbi:MAG: site-specific integrase [Cyanobacteria bacterium J06642_2]